MFEVYFKLFLSSLVPIGLSVLFFVLKEFTSFKDLDKTKRQIIIGVAFGLAAIFGTEFGVNVGGATANARDAAPLCAGLLFGGPAGIIAGVIGGVERFFAAYWGRGTYSQIACSLSTLLAGFYAALLRKYMFENKRPSWGLALATGIVVETFHLVVLFLTHLDDPVNSFAIVKICALPMILTNSNAVMLSVLIVGTISYYTHGKTFRQNNINQIIQKWLLAAVALLYLFTSLFVYTIQTGKSNSDVSEVFSLNIADIKNDMKSGEISSVAKNRHIGSTGFVIITDNDGNVVSADTSHYVSNVNELGLDINKSHDTLQELELNEEDVLYMVSRYETYQIIVFQPTSETYEVRDMMVYINSFMEILAYGMLFISVYFLINKLVVSKINAVNKKLDLISNGNLDTQIDDYRSVEFKSLSKDINLAVATLKGYIEREKTRIDTELAFAKNIQHSALPSIFPAFPNIKEFDIFASMDTAKEVGGDFYDFYMINKDELAFLIADVSGKGIPAAMFMMQSKTIIKSLTENGLSLDEVFTKANEKLCANNDMDMFVTAWMGILNIKTGHVRFVNAGHNAPLICRNGKYDYFKSKVGFVLAGFDGFKYQLQEFDLQPGDKILLYTDGVTEANNINKELYSEPRLANTLNSNTKLDVTQTIDLVKKDLKEFSGECEQFDDITMLCLEFKK